MSQTGLTAVLNEISRPLLKHAVVAFGQIAAFTVGSSLYVTVAIGTSIPLSSA
jgi:hypothetical protein